MLETQTTVRIAVHILHSHVCSLLKSLSSMIKGKTSKNQNEKQI